MQDFDPLKWAGDGPDTGPALGDTPPEDYPFPDGRERRKGADAAEQLIPAEAVRVGVVGAPGSTDEVVVDIAADAAASSLVGRWIAVPFSQDDAPAIAVGQVTRVRMENDFRSIGAVRSAGSHGGVLPGGAADDLYQADITVTATFRCEVEGGRCHIVPSILGTVPPSGTEVFMVSDSMLERLLARNADDLFFLGHAWGGAPGGAPMLPTWIRHFQKGEGGAGDTYHLGIFGKTGAGKSVLAKMVMLGFARHQGTSLFVLDPQGEFSRDAGGTRSAHEGFALPWRDIIEQQTGKRLRVVPLRSLVLDTWELFQDVIGQGVLFRWLGYGKGEKRALAAEHLTAILRRERRTLPSLASREAFERVFEIVREEDFVKRIYVAEEAISRNIQRALDFWEDEEKREETYRVWRQVTALFDESRQGSVAVSELIRGVADPGKGQVVVLNLSREGLDEGVSISAGSRDLLWNDEIQGMLVHRLLAALRAQGEASYLKGGRLNTMVVLDEAHRFVPRGQLAGQEEEIRDLLVGASRETRKYGIGWLFVSQTLASLHPEVIHQLRVLFAGFGLNGGSERQTLSELAGGDRYAMNLYLRFPDPQAAPSEATRSYNYMALGPVSPLAFAGQPLFLSAFTSPEHFLLANGLTGEDDHAAPCR